MSKASSPVKSLTAYNLIRELVLSGEVLPGTRLILADLEQKLGVGRVPIREAIMRLDKTGLVQNVPYKGAIVMRPPSFREMESIYQMRVLAERTMAVEAMRKAKPKDLYRLEKIADEMARSCMDEPLFFHRDREFHRNLYSISDMRHLQLIVESLLVHVEILLNGRYYEYQDKELFLAQHRALLEALKAKDEELLCKTLEENILVGLKMVQKEMERFQLRREGPVRNPE